MEKVTIKVGGMHCVRCERALFNALNNKEGIIDVNVSYASEKAKISYDSNKITYKEICEVIKKSGYYVVEINEKDKELKSTVVLFLISLVLTIPFLIMMILMLMGKHSNVFHNGWFQLAFVTPIQFIVGYKFYKGAVDSLKNKSPNMDLLVALGTSVAYFYSLYNVLSNISVYYFESCAFVITLVYLGKLLEMKSKRKTNEALSSLLKLKPNKVTLVEGDIYKEIDVSELKVNDLFLVRAGENIATDGVIVNGSSNLDESMLTGESFPKLKKENDEVYGGTVNIDGVLVVKANKVGEDTVLSKIIKMVESAEGSKAKVQRLADKVSAYFVPVIIGVSIIAFIVNYLISKDISLSVSRLVAVLVIACPCSLGLATPTAIIVGMGIAAKKGILIKDADTLEKICKVKSVVLDKTGTITEGEMKVSKIDVKGIEEKEFLELICAVESYSNHPLAKAIVEYYNNSKIKLDSVKEIIGKGIEATYKNKRIKVGSYNYLSEYIREDYKDTSIKVFMVINDELVGIVHLVDSIKESSKVAVSKLKDINVEVVLASGDNKLVCKSVADSVGIDVVYSEVLPEDKYKIVNNLKEKGLVAMVGDGINDAPAIASSDVGVSMGSAIDVAIESGDIVIMNNDLINVYNCLMISKATMKKIKQNLFWAFFYNCASVPLAAFGLISPIIAGICMSLSSVSVVSNSLLLNKLKL